MKIVLNDIEYELIKNYRDAYDEEAVKERITDYFNEYDYVFGDWAYGKLRLKGFYKNDNKKVTKINNIEDLDKYIKENCAFDCKYFLLEKK
ncbi:MAG: YutD family protein [Erysipelotrichales bacterium]|nr:YutD family protein [Erysipelotrichales bacterium]